MVIIVAGIVFAIFNIGRVFEKSKLENSSPQLETSNVIINDSQEALVASEDWGGAVPMKVYQVFDRETGVYYAVTEKGGICVMQTMSGETKLVDQGDGNIVHPNQGE